MRPPLQTAFADETGCGIGDVIAVDTTDDEESSLPCSRFTVTGIVVDAGCQQCKGSDGVPLRAVGG